MMRLFVLAMLATSCAPKPGPVVESPKKKPALERLPADAVLWEGPALEGVEPLALLEKDGVLTRNKDREDGGRFWPYAIDQWGLARSDLATLLGPHVGRTVRVKGHYKKTYADGTWFYEVEPIRITALADPPAPPAP